MSVTLIFVAGGSGSGKTTFAKKLSKQLHAQVISMDDYFVEAPIETSNNPEALHFFRHNTNFDREEMFDYPLLKEHLTALSNGKTITKPIFDFPTNRRLTSERVSPSRFIIIEGLFALSFAKTLPKNLDKITIFTSTSSYTSLINTRVNRDIRERARTREDVLRQEKKFVGDAFFRIIAKSKTGVDMDILNDPHTDPAKLHPLDEGVIEVLTTLRKMRVLEPVAAQECFNEQLKVLHTKMLELALHKDSTAGEKAYELHKKLSIAGDIYFYGVQNEHTYSVFKTDCDKAINDARPVLETHRGWKQVLGNLGLAIAGLGIFYLAAIVINKAVNNKFLFFKTDSAQKIDAIEDFIHTASAPAA